MESQRLRGVILKIQDRLTDNDRKRLHFFLGNDVTRRVRDDPTLGGTLNLIESLFDQDKINEEDFTFLINAFDEIQCIDAVKILREHKRRMHIYGMEQSVQSLSSIMPSMIEEILDDEDEDKHATEHSYLMKQQSKNGNNNMLINNNTSINQMTIIMENENILDSKSRRRFFFGKKLLISACLLLFTLFCIISLSISIGICVRKIRHLRHRITTESENLNQLEIFRLKHNETIQQWMDLLEHVKQNSHLSNVIPPHARWAKKGITVFGVHGPGEATNQLYFPKGLYFDETHIFLIADTGNHRILEWKINTQNVRVVAGGISSGNGTDQLQDPTDVLIDHVTDRLIICDRGNQRVIEFSRKQNATKYGTVLLSNVTCFGLAMDSTRWLYVSEPEMHAVKRYRIGHETNGTLIAGGHGKGNHRNQLNFPLYIVVDRNQSLYISDKNNHRVMKWIKNATEGVIVAGNQNQGNTLKQLWRPEGLSVDSLGTVYVVDAWNHRVMRWAPGATEGTIIAGVRGYGNDSDQLRYPRGLVFDRQSNLYVADYENHRIQKFQIEMN